MTLDQCRKIFHPGFVKQLTSVRVNGNFGDIMMNPEGADIVEYLRSLNADLQIRISTNGGARDRKFWQRLATAGAQVTFALDGLEDTHHLYRQNTLWKTVIKNAKIFIEHGGQAEWQMIEFEHNQHQIPEAEKISRELGFSKFTLIQGQRNTAPVFDQHGNLSHILGDYQGETEFEILFYRKKNDTVLLEDIITDRKPKSKISCETKELKSIYIAANGDVSPCCFTGFFPRTYGHGQYHQAANSQLLPLINRNNALEYPLEECIEWFSSVEKSWAIDSYEQGRLVICDDNCGTFR
jgi:MoaA/NifB/PqqE/SkfB family radical SAM enzyme